MLITLTRVSSLRLALPLGMLLAAGGAVQAGPPQGGFSLPRGGNLGGLNLPFKPQGGGFSGVNLPFKPQGIPGTLPALSGLKRPLPMGDGVAKLPGGPIRVPNGPWMGGMNPGNGQNPGEPHHHKGNGVGIAIASQVLQGLISQIGTGAYGGSSGGYADPGYSSGGGEVCPASASIPVEPSVPEAPPTSSQGNTTALQIVDLDRGPAARAGLQKGDIILRVDDQRMKTQPDLTAALAASRGTSVIQFVNSDTGRIETREVPVVGGKIGVAVVEIPVQLDESEPAPALPVPAPAPPVPAPASPVPAGETAVQLTEVRPGNALDAGLQVKDVILSIDGKKIATPENLVAAFKASTGSSEIEFYRPEAKKVQTVTMTVETGKIGLGVKTVPIEIR